MGKVKQLWQEKTDKVHDDFVNKKITFTEAYKALCQLGYGPDYAIDSLDSCSQIELFPESTGAKYGETKFN